MGLRLNTRASDMSIVYRRKTALLSRESNKLQSAATLRQTEACREFFFDSYCFDARLTLTELVRPLLTRIETSVRRFCFRPSRVELSATGMASPYPYGSTIRRNGMPWSAR